MIFIETEFLIDVLVFLSVFAVTQYTLGKLLRNNKVATIIGLVIALLAVFYMSQTQISFLELNYGYAATFALVIFPLAIIFLFVYTTDIPGLARKAIWIAYGIITFILVQRNTTITSQALTLSLLLLVLLIAALITFDTFIKNRVTEVKNLRRGQRKP